jgi:predicted MPP superfamily phosphohydrolase
MKLILIMLAVIIAIHVFVYNSTVSFFTIKGQADRNSLKILLAVFSLSFIASVILPRFWHHIFFDMYYAASAFWIGLLVNIVIFFLIGWILIFLLKIFGFEPKSAVGSAALLCAAAFSFYGAWAAFNPIVKDIDIGFRGLPEAWKGKTVIQLSDLHLGKINRVSFAEKVVSQVNALNPYIIFITGDLFDGMRSDPGKFMETINKLQSEKGIYLVTGNHEAYLGKELVFEKLAKSKLLILENKIVNIDGIQVIGVGFQEYGEGINEADEIKKIPGFDPKKPSILLHHLPTSIAQKQQSASSRQTEIYWSPNIDFHIAKENGVRLQLSGHSHAGQIFPFGLLTRILYKGYDYGLHTDGDFNIYTTSGTGTWGPPLRTAKRGEIVSIHLTDKQ